VNRNLLIGIAAAAIVVAGAVFYFSQQGGGGGGAAAMLAQRGGEGVDIKATDKVHGQANAPVTIVEYASLTCPHCAAFQKDVVPKLNAEYVDKGKVRVIYRDFPLDGAARLAGATAQCMTGDNYFAFVDLLFRNQAEWTRDFDNNQQLTKEDIQEGLVVLGRRAGLSRERVLACGDDPKNLKVVDDNWQEGQNRYKVDSTPTFVINGTVHKGGMSYEALKGMLDPLLAGK
jgi:protein-disulfide isomerase